MSLLNKIKQLSPPLILNQPRIRYFSFVYFLRLRGNVEVSPQKNEWMFEQLPPKAHKFFIQIIHKPNNGWVHKGLFLFLLQKNKQQNSSWSGSHSLNQLTAKAAYRTRTYESTKTNSDVPTYPPTYSAYRGGNNEPN